LFVFVTSDCFFSYRSCRKRRRKNDLHEKGRNQEKTQNNRLEARNPKSQVGPEFGPGLQMDKGTVSDSNGFPNRGERRAVAGRAWQVKGWFLMRGSQNHGLRLNGWANGGNARGRERWGKKRRKGAFLVFQEVTRPKEEKMSPYSDGTRSRDGGNRHAATQRGCLLFATHCARDIEVAALKCWVVR